MVPFATRPCCGHMCCSPPFPRGLEGRAEEVVRVLSLLSLTSSQLYKWGGGGGGGGTLPSVPWTSALSYAIVFAGDHLGDEGTWLKYP